MLAKVAWTNDSFALGNVPVLIAPSLLILCCFLPALLDTDTVDSDHLSLSHSRLSLWLARTAKKGGDKTPDERLGSTCRCTVQFGKGDATGMNRTNGVCLAHSPAQHVSPVRLRLYRLFSISTRTSELPCLPF